MIDQEGKYEHPWKKIKKIKNTLPKSLIAVAGGLDFETCTRAINNGADIIVIGRAITQATDIKLTINNFLQLL